MQAYETSLKPGETRILISPDASSFFRYFADPLGGAPTASQDVLPPVPAVPTNGAGAPTPVVPVVPPAQPAR
ncbi:MAG: hypothetical protein B7Z15_18710 [Rhizobiales bacterium 32-66-8]|nr:MAG: hypothetical protein B7Z15_18710 [Rhizobiales bacterium 32-66-8]